MSKTKSPVAYYGGKANLASEILPLIPRHVQYVEPFFGSGAIFWGRSHRSKNEVINDLNGSVTNFYWQLKTNFVELQKMVQATLHSEILYIKAKEMLKDDACPPLEKAWAFWVGCNMAFGHVLFGGFAFCETGSGGGTKNKRDGFNDKFTKRLEYCEIFNRDAVELIELKDSENTFFYVDPPYVSSEQGHYAGYTTEDFIKLLNVLKSIKGKFLMSSYLEEILMKYREECGWLSKDIKQVVLVSGKREETKYKIECLTMNYTPPNNQAGLFDEARAEEKEEFKEMVESELAPEPQEDGEPIMERAERLLEEKDEPIFTEEELNEGKEL